MIDLPNKLSDDNGNIIDYNDINNKKWFIKEILPNNYLAKIFKEGHIFIDGNHIKIRDSIDPLEGWVLYSLIIKNNLKKTLEIGFAFGISTIYICQAHKDLNNSVNSHIVIDPFQTLNYNDIGVKNLEASGLSDFYSLKKEESWKVLSELDSKFDLILIDGFHTFDYTLVDFGLSDRLLNVGGYIIIDDILHKPVEQFIKYFRNEVHNYKIINIPYISTQLIIQKISNKQTIDFTDIFINFFVSQKTNNQFTIPFNQNLYNYISTNLNFLEINVENNQLIINEISKDNRDWNYYQNFSMTNSLGFDYMSDHNNGKTINTTSIFELNYEIYNLPTKYDYITIIDSNNSFRQYINEIEDNFKNLYRVNTNVFRKKEYFQLMKYGPFVKMAENKQMIQKFILKQWNVQTKNFPAPLPVTLNNLWAIQNNYVACEKSDGERFLFVIFKNVPYFVNRKFDVYRIGNDLLPYDNLIYDGELVLNNDIIYYVHDCVCINDINISKDKFYDRIGKFINISINQFKVILKDFYSVLDFDELVLNSQNKQIDGYIFTPIDEPVGSFTQYSLYKWKYINTIDLQTSNENEKTQFLLQNNDVLFEADAKFKGIIEVEVLGDSFKILKPRPDKIMGNSDSTTLDAINLSNKNITFSILSKFLKNNQVPYLNLNYEENKWHSKFIKTILKNKEFNKIPFIPNISFDEGKQLYKLIRDNDIKHTLEIGFNYGETSFFMTEANKDRSDSSHTVISNNIISTQIVKYSKINYINLNPIDGLLRQTNKYDLIYITEYKTYADLIQLFYYSSNILNFDSKCAIIIKNRPSSQQFLRFLILNNTKYYIEHTPYSKNQIIIGCHNNQQNNFNARKNIIV